MSSQAGASSQAGSSGNYDAITPMWTTNTDIVSASGRTKINLLEQHPMVHVILQDAIDIVHLVLRPRAYLMCHAFICTYILLYTSRVSLMCTTGPPYRSYQTSPLSRYLAALDLLTRHGSPAYLGHTSHARAAPSTHTYLHCFWHA